MLRRLGTSPLSNRLILLLRHLVCFGLRRGVARLGRVRRGLRCWHGLLRRLFLDRIHHARADARPVRDEVREHESSEEENRGQDGRGARKKIGRAARAEQASRGAAAESRAHVRPFAVLEQDQTDDAERDDDVDDECQCKPEIHVLSLENDIYLRAAAQIAMKSSATSDAPPISPPSTSGIANSSLALPGLTLPPYTIVARCASPRSRAASRARMNACTSWACCGVAFLPVPIAQTGS